MVDVADDAVDLDIGYSGTIDTVFVLRRGDTGSAFEFGGCAWALFLSFFLYFLGLIYFSDTLRLHTVPHAMGHVVLVF